MTTISGHHTKTVTLTPGAPDVAITGTINAYGHAGTYNGQTVSAAVYGPPGTSFTLLNKGLIESAGTSPRDAGVVLDSPGTITNHSTISGGAGILIFGGPGASVTNTGLVEGNAGDGIFLQSASAVQNTGLIAALATAVAISATGYVTNSGYIEAATGISANGAASQIDNAATGHIQASLDGIVLAAGGSVTNAGSITASSAAVMLAAAGYIANSGYLSGGADAVDLAAGGSLVNGGRLLGPIALYVGGGAAYALNQAADTFSGTTFGIDASNAAVTTKGVISGVSAGVLLHGGTLDNLAGGTLSGSVGVEGITAWASVQNAGLIRDTLVSYQQSTLNTGIFLLAGGAVSNSGTVIGESGIKIKSQPGTITNSGLILSDGSPDAGIGTVNVIAAVDLYDGGSLTNTGSIAAPSNSDEIGTAIVLQQSGYVLNDGFITGAVSFFAGGAFISNGYDSDGSVDFLKSGTVENFGYMTDVGIDLQAGGLFLNDNIVKAYGSFAGFEGPVFFGFPAVTLNAGATLINDYDLLSIQLNNPGYVAVTVTNGGNIINSGWIKGNVDFASAANNLMVVQPGTTITGTISGGGGILNMASGATAGILSQVVTYVGGHGYVTIAPFADFSTVTVEKGATWEMRGNITLPGTISLTNDGTLAQTATDSLMIDSKILGKGEIDVGGNLTLDGAIAKGQDIRFNASSETLSLGDVSGFSGTIKNFAAGDTIIVDGFEKGLLTEFALSKGVLTIASIGTIEHITFASPKSFGADHLEDFADGSAIGITLTAVAASAMNFVAGQPAAATLPSITQGHTRQTAAISPPSATASATTGWLDTNLLSVSLNITPMVTMQA